MDLKRKFFLNGQIKNLASDIIQKMGKEKRIEPAFIKEVKRRHEILTKSEEFKKRIEAIKIPEIRRTN